MSDPHAHAAHDAHADHDGHPESTFGGYMTGFILSVILTAVPFALVMTGVLTDVRLTAYIVMALAMVQIVVHMVYFLHMTPKAEGGWSMMALIFTIIIVVIALSGSLWVMYHMNANMMPGMVTGDASPM